MYTFSLIIFVALGPIFVQGSTNCNVNNCPTSPAPLVSPPTSTEKNKILKFHNDIRQEVASGNAVGANNQILPPSDCLCELKWDNVLALCAQEWANRCTFAHNDNSCRCPNFGSYVGQNLVIKFYSGTSPTTLDYDTIMNGWYEGEIEIFKKSFVNAFESGEWGHYSQLIWGNTKYVGCGATIYKKGSETHHLLVCNYGPGGNYIGQPTYNTQCTACPSGTSPSSVYPDLCA